MFKFRGSFIINVLKFSVGICNFIDCKLFFAALQDDLTPLSLAKSENKEQMVEFLLSRSASMHAVNQMDRYICLSFFLTLILF